MADENAINAPVTAAGKALLDDANAAAQRVTMGVEIGVNVQAYDAGLLSIAGLTTAADKMIYTSALDTYVVTDLTSFARTMLDDANAAAVQATLSLVPGTDVQAFDATLLSIAALGTAADRIAYTTGVDVWAETPLTTQGRALLDDTTQLAQAQTILDNVGVSAATVATGDKILGLDLDDSGNLKSYTAQSIADLSPSGTVTSVTGTANRITSTGGATPVIDIAATYVGQASITTLGTITTGVWTGTDIAVADGGTGSSTAGGARTNLGVAIGSNVQAFDATLTALAAFDTDGILTQTATDTFVGRTLTGTAVEITVTNGDGVAGNPTFSLPTAMTFTGKTITGGTYAGAAATTFTFTTGSIGTAVTGVTQSAGDASTLLATTLYADTAGGGGIQSVQVFVVGATWTKPAGITKVQVIVIGGGAGGGGVATTSSGQGAASAGGAAGGTAIEFIDVSAISSETVTIGALGAGGVAGNNAGTSGGTSSFGAHCSATGGAGGAGGPAVTPPVIGGSAGAVGGVGSGGDINIQGGSSYTGIMVSSTRGRGGGGGLSHMGGGAPDKSVGSDGADAGNYGAGGSGAAIVASQTQRPGGDGSVGIVIVWEYK